MKSWIAWLEDVGKDDIKRCGSKFSNLGELSRIGMPVPFGFAVMAQAYEVFLKETDAGREIHKYLGGLKREHMNIDEYEKRSQTICNIIVTNELPGEVGKAVCDAYEALCQRLGCVNLGVAVRSSGIDEDLPEAAFAGQYESYVNVKGKEDVLNRVRDCWSSLFSGRGIAYRIKNKIPIFAGAMAVIVQRMIDARSAGVAFTMLPGHGDTSRVMIEGNWGIAESVVQGSVVPDKYIINKEELTLEEKRISNKLRQVSLRERGSVEEDTPAEKQSAPCLSDNEAVR